MTKPTDADKSCKVSVELTNLTFLHHN